MRKGYIIPLVFILIVALAAIVGSIAFLTTTGVRYVGTKAEAQKALYIAEAGLNKAIWYLSTATSEGGRSIYWRTAGATEEFGGGNYTLVVENDPAGIKITSKSKYGNRDRTLEILADESFGGVFASYAVLADSSVKIESGAKVEGGTVGVTEGHTITGAGDYVEGSTSAANPIVDMTYYDAQISVASAGGSGVVQGNKTYAYLNLSGLPLYIKGNVIITGNITGAGEIIVAGNITVEPGAIIGEKVKLIAKNGLVIKNLTQLKKNSLLYSQLLVEVKGGLSNPDEIIIITPKKLIVGQNTKLKGVFYGGELNLGQNTTIEGNVIASSSGVTQTLVGTIIFKQPEQSVPPGFEKKVTFKKWLKK